MGIIYATQWYNKIPPEIKSAKLNYLIAFKTSNEIAKQIAGDFVLDNPISFRWCPGF